MSSRLHPCELEADMHEVYGVDVRNPGCSVAHLACLAAQLGPGSRLARAYDERNAWDESDYLLAHIADSIAYLRYELAGCKGKKPKAIDRPKSAPKKDRPRSHHVPRRKLDRILSAPRV